jgi:hypothetical protein
MNPLNASRRRRIGGSVAAMNHDKITNQRVARIAEDHRCSIADVNAALDHHPIETNREKYLRRLLALELVELDELAEAFREKAVVDRDVASGVLLTKIHERRATLLGLNAPAAAAVAIIEHERPTAETSTEKIRAAVERIRNQRLPAPDPGFDSSDRPN